MKNKDKQKPVKSDRASNLPSTGGPHWLWFAALAAFGLLCAVYGPALSGPFVLDDLYLPFSNPQYLGQPLLAWILGVRPVLMLTYWLNFKMAGQEPFTYHVFNVLFHFAAGVFVWLIIRRLLDRVSTRKSTANLIATFCALVFLFHPLHSEAVAYVASRSENLTVMLLYGAMALFVSRKGDSVTWAGAAGVIALFGAACLSKEYAVVLPAVLLAADYFFFPGFSFAGIRGNWKLYVPVFGAAIAGGAFVWRGLSQAATAGFAMKDLSWSDYFFTQCRAIWVYVVKFAIPVGLNVDYDFPISRGVMDHGAIVGLIALLAAVGAALFYARRFPLASFGFLCFLIFIAPTSSFVPIADVVAERRVYVASIGLLLIACEFLRRVRFDAVKSFALIAIPLVFAIGTFQRAALWGDPVRLWADAAEKSPGKFRVQFQSADALYRVGRCAEAAKGFERTSKLAPPDFRVLINWGHALECNQQLNQAVEKYREASGLEPSAHALALIGKVRAVQNRNPEAAEAFEAAIKVDPNFDMTYTFRGAMHLKNNDPVKAKADFLKSLAINPNNQYAQQGLSHTQ